MKNINKKVASAILRAQLHSDAAKDINIIAPETRAQKREFKKCKCLYRNKHYDFKDEYILKAITGILCNKHSGFTFYVTHSCVTTYLVYFNFKVEGKRYQVSFHSYEGELEKYVSNRCRTHWDQRDSREAALILQEYLKNN